MYNLWLIIIPLGHVFYDYIYWILILCLWI